MSKRHLSREARLAELRLDPRLDSHPGRPRETTIEPPARRRSIEPQRRRSILPRVIAAIAVVGLAAYLLNGLGGPSGSSWQNVHSPVVPTHITPDGLPGRS
jgi:hypothetical protein